jgi:riboflavin biosynthesis pyrimidine reductase
VRHALARARTAADVRLHDRDGGLHRETRPQNEAGKMSIVAGLRTTDNRIPAAVAEGEKPKHMHGAEKDMGHIARITWTQNQSAGWPHTPLTARAPGPEWELLRYPAASGDTPRVILIFVQAQSGVVGGVGTNGIVVEPEHILGVKSYPAGERLAPDSDGLAADQRTMRSWRALAHKVVWGAGIVRQQQTLTLDLLGSMELRDFRTKHGLPELPPLVIVTDSGREVGGAAGYTHPVFHTPGLRVILLTNEAQSARLTAEVARAKLASTEVWGFGQAHLDLRSALKYFRAEEGDALWDCEGGHALAMSLWKEGLVDMAFLTTTPITIDPANLANAQRMLSFAQEGFARVAHGAAGHFTFDWWVKPELLP